MELIVFDLDGTLLNDASQITPFTRETLALLTKRNIAYTVATGRTLHSAKSIIAGHGFTLPHIYSNGVIIWDPQQETLALENMLTVDEVSLILDATTKYGVTPFITTVDAKHQHVIYHPTVQSNIEERLLNDFIIRPGAIVKPLTQMPAHTQITNVSVLGLSNVIDSIEQAISTEAHLVAYSGQAIEGNGLKWMDIHHSNASKGGAVQLLREQLGVSKLLCFGDNNNDLSMFATADESYAPANATDEVKAAATAVIGDHDADGIAHYLRHRFEL